MRKKDFKSGLDGMIKYTRQSIEEDNECKQTDFETSQSRQKPKWSSFTKVNALLGENQKDFLDSLTKRVMRSRKKGSERITSNSILRCLINVLETRADNLDLSEISSEKDLTERLSKL